MASGMPSSREHTSAIAPALPAVSANPGLAARAQVTNRAPAFDAATAPPEPSSGSSSGGTGKTNSPGTSRRSLLVVRMRTRRHCPASMTTTRPTDARTCSQLSSTISSSRSASARHARHRVDGISFRDSQRLGDGRGNEHGIGEGGQLDQPGAVLEAAGGQRSRPQREPGLTAPARPGQRHHAGGAQAVQDRGELRPASHQRAHLRGETGVLLGRAFGHDHPRAGHQV